MNSCTGLRLPAIAQRPVAAKSGVCDCHWRCWTGGGGAAEADCLRVADAEEEECLLTVVPIAHCCWCTELLVFATASFSAALDPAGTETSEPVQGDMEHMICHVTPCGWNLVSQDKSLVWSAKIRALCSVKGAELLVHLLAAPGRVCHVDGCIW